MKDLSATKEPLGSDYGQAMNAIVIAENFANAYASLEAVENAGFRLLAQIGFDDADHLGEYGALDLILVETASAPEALVDVALARVDTFSRERSLNVVACVPRDHIDLAAAHLMGPRCQILCEPGEAERLGALAIARAQAELRASGEHVRTRVHDSTRDSDAVQLRRLSDEIARIAEALTRLTREEPARNGALRETGNGYHGPDQLDRPHVSASEIRAAIRARRLRAQFFQGDLFADPAWDMLLDLYASDLEHRQVSVSSLCIAASVPPTTALRWIGTLHDAGLFERRADPSDRRRAYIALSEKGLDGMRDYLAAVKRQGLALA